MTSDQKKRYIYRYSLWKDNTWKQWFSLISQVTGVLFLDHGSRALDLLTDSELSTLFTYCRQRSLAGNPIGLP
jgi:hypothetical protein